MISSRSLLVHIVLLLLLARRPPIPPSIARLMCGPLSSLRCPWSDEHHPVQEKLRPSLYSRALNIYIYRELYIYILFGVFKVG